MPHESGEDYLFQKSQFAFVDFPQAVRKRILALQEASIKRLEPTAEKHGRSSSGR